MIKHIVSIGSGCGLTQVMQRYGLREHAGTFDWIHSDFKGVMETLYTDFEDFLNVENLVKLKDCYFEDKKYGLLFPHELEYSTWISRRDT